MPFIAASSYGCFVVPLSVTMTLSIRGQYMGVLLS
ncbi:hypothetical protein T11_18561 [Trichinella zimbabwensis]|uniref:Uncharacterized protein n=1 Tax=Trichinella zimbabwensis TaxID=268475 RepID=A0A0V1GKW5_9BILA|nr:hypothetical protein T11_18561 [Trichinella zimbabwensis]